MWVEKLLGYLYDKKGSIRLCMNTQTKENPLRNILDKFNTG